MAKQTPKDEWITLDGLSFHYRDWGGSGQRVVLLHGLASTCHIWDLVAPILAQDCTVVAMDQRGHGDSTKPEEGYDFPTVSTDVQNLVLALGMQSPIVIGHSWGGDVALALGAARPGMAKGLGFVDGGMINASGRFATLEEAKVQMAPPDFTGVKVQDFVDRVRSRPLASAMGEAAESIILANFEVLDDGTIRAKLSRDNHLRIIEALWEHHPSALYPKVECPVLVMPARQEGEAAAEERRQNRLMSVGQASELLPISKTVWFEDSIHDVPVQRPELVAEVIGTHIAQGFFN